eukprot:2290094-Prymnesium_polylepis.1
MLDPPTGARPNRPNARPSDPPTLRPDTRITGHHRSKTRNLSTRSPRTEPPRPDTPRPDTPRPDTPRPEPLDQNRSTADERLSPRAGGARARHAAARGGSLQGAALAAPRAPDDPGRALRRIARRQRRCAARLEP